MIASRRRRRLVFYEDFSSGLDPTRWVAEVRKEHNVGSVMYYTDRPKNVRVEGGNLVIEAHREQYGDQPWTSGSVCSVERMAWRYGRIEARIALPMARGMWPAFWTLGYPFDNFLDGTGEYYERGYPLCGEIDIMEAYHAQQRTESNIWTLPSWSLGGEVFPVPDRSQFHIYGMEWCPEFIQFYVDGRLGKRIEIGGRDQSLHWAHQLRLNLAVGPAGQVPDGSTPSPSAMLVDWVKVWSPIGNARTHAPAGISIAQSSASLRVGNLGGIRLTPTITPEDAHNQGTAWDSSDPAVAICKSGWVVPVAPGTCVVTARTWNGHEATCNVTVTP